eukprot:CAMPEP_0117487338 /NCGR_PEP_ID=MMETSP0784-20121206/15944_1 /TAXON_ID=39447 /ORGANISM="" /LENGTH=341 /DNA_ID=CAMNT_0005281983 /DNA_START=79 /DNA_END=1104 /DNA_ORIENTATION=-
MACRNVRSAIMLGGGLLLQCFQVAHAAPYSVYTAKLTELDGSGVSGSVTVFVTSTGLMGIGEAAGLETFIKDEANSGSNCTKTNACGAHVHNGSSCSSSSVQGGHYFNGDTDPWTKVGYGITDADGMGSFKFDVTTSAKSVDQKPFIVHDNAGGRVACGILKEVTVDLWNASLAPLSLSGSSSGVKGSVTIHKTSTGLVGAGAADGLEKSLSSQANGGNDCKSTNGCGVHVHSGTACTDAESQGDHYYTGDTDPWTNVVYDKTDGKGFASFVFMVTNGATNITDKPFIVHNNAGGRVSCGLLGSTTTTTTTTGAAGSLINAGVRLVAPVLSLLLAAFAMLL